MIIDQHLCLETFWPQDRGIAPCSCPEANKTTVLGRTQSSSCPRLLCFSSLGKCVGDRITPSSVQPLPLAQLSCAPSPAGRVLLIPHTEEAAEAQRVAQGVSWSCSPDPFPATCFLQSFCFAVED